jgi:hypothetical protein
MASITKIQPRPHTYRVDNIIVDEYGEKIGAIGVAIYNLKVARKWRCPPCEPHQIWLSRHQRPARACRSSSL